MRKNIVPRPASEAEREQGWLSLEKLARVEMSSEDPSHPIESALLHDPGSGWRAAEPGAQFIRLLFDEPVNLRRIFLRINEEDRSRTQELVLRWSQDQGRSYLEIVRQQYNFNPPGTTSEQEEYSVDLAGVTALEIEIVPDISGSSARASLARLRLG